MANLFSKIVAKYRALPTSTKGYLLILMLLIIAVLLRWEEIIEKASKGFSFFSK